MSASIKELKRKSPDELLKLAEEHNVEDASGMLKQEQIFAILKAMAEADPDDLELEGGDVGFFG